MISKQYVRPPLLSFLLLRSQTSEPREQDAMGGHGGLNILPQKSWNVYGQRNRQKVAEDEAERDAKEAAHREQQERAGRERRLRQLRADPAAEV